MASIISAESSCVRRVGCARKRKPGLNVSYAYWDGSHIVFTKALEEAATEELVVEALVESVDKSVDVLCN